MKVVIIGGLHHNTLGVLRAIGECNISKIDINVIIVGEDIPYKNIISSSRYVKKENIKYAVDYENIVPCLLKLSSDGKKRTIICCSDGATEYVIKNKDILTKVYSIPSTLLDISIVMEKNQQGEIAKSVGLSVPEGKIFDTKNATEWNLFPCIIKPLKSIAGAGKSDINVVNNEEELASALSHTSAAEVQIQKYINKQMEFQLIGCSLDAGNKIIIPGYTRIIRQPINTNTGFLEYRPIKDFNINMDSVQKMIKTIGYSGLFSMEFVRDFDGQDYFLEINMRNDGNAYCVTTAGINLPYIWCYYQTYGVIPNVPMDFDDPVFFIPDFNDLKIAIKENGIFCWIRDFCKSQSHSIYNKKDIKPFFNEIKRIICKAFH